jgi:cleavage and polyadenylation specificity factor subunit 5
MRRTVEGLLVVHEHGHPHVLLLQVANSFFKLPGDYLQPHEDEIDGLQHRMYLRLGPETGSGSGSEDKAAGTGVKGEDDEAMNGGVGSGGINDWSVGEPVGHFWRPNFETFMVRCRPSVPLGLSDWAADPLSISSRAVPLHACVRRPPMHALHSPLTSTRSPFCRHISDPKERKTWYLINMPERRESCSLCAFAPSRLRLHAPVSSAEILTVPKNMKLVALPLFELYDNAVR